MLTSVASLLATGLACISLPGCGNSPTPSPPPSPDPSVPSDVVVDNFHRAESDHYFADFVAQGAFANFLHIREPTPLKLQTIVRSNQDTLYSWLVLDLRQSPATIRFPKADGRYVSMLRISEDHDIYPQLYEPGTYTFSADSFPTPYMILLLRTFMDPKNATDMMEAHAIQDGFTIEQDTKGSFAVPNWNQTDLATIRTAIATLARTTTTLPSQMFGIRSTLDRLAHDMGTAGGWGGQRPSDATYFSFTPQYNLDMTPYTLTVKDVPIEGNGFWSITVYNSTGFLFDERSNYNDMTAIKENDGSYTIHFGNCGDTTRKNCLPIEPGWNYLVRLYRPGKAILNGTWRLPAAVPSSFEPGSLETSSSQRAVVDNFHRAETDRYFANFARLGSLGKIVHERDMTPLGKQDVIRMNKDTLYSYALLDLRSSPVTVSIPEAGSRFVSLQRISEDHDIYPAIYQPGNLTISKDTSSTPYLVIVIRTFVDSANESDLAAAHAVQDAFHLEQEGGPGKFDCPAWNPTDLTTIRSALLVLAATTTTPMSKMFGFHRDLDRESFEMGAASAWGANLPQDATYINGIPKLNDGTTTYRLKVKDVPIEGNGFWSITVYSASGFMFSNRSNYNDRTAVRDFDGSYTINFGGCASAQTNCVDITRGWNYLVRLYRPGPQILNGSWKFPEAYPIKLSELASSSRFEDAIAT